MFPRRNIHKYIWPSDIGKTHSQIDNILIDRRPHSNILDARYFKGADCGTDHFLVVAEVREGLLVNKRKTQNFDIKKLNLKNLI
jgi:hypothetical protein